MKKSANKQSISLKEVLQTSRPLWWISTAVPFFVGYLVSTASFSWPLIIGTFYFLFPYNLFMYGVNDIFDYETDIRNPRKTDVMPKTKHKSMWAWILLTNIPFWAYFFLNGSCTANSFLLVIIFMAFAYSIKYLRFKEIPLLDSLTSSFHYTSPFLFGILFAGGSNLWLPAFISFYIWAVANHAFGAIQDITPDREAGIGSVATAFGATKTIILCLVIYGIAVILPTAFYGAYGLIPSLLLLPYIFLVGQTWKSRSDDTAKIFTDNWNKFVYTNYVVGFLMSVYLIMLAYRS
jgi:4-hydroxybenzoate polyprenyltransferase